MSVRQQRWLGLGLAAIVSGLLLLALGRVTVAPRTDRAAVMALLDQRGIAYRVSRCVPALAACRRTGTPTWRRWRWPRSAPAYGTIVCQARLDACVVWIDALGMQQVALPAVTPAEPWVEHAQTSAARGGATAADLAEHEPRGGSGGGITEGAYQ